MGSGASAANADALIAQLKQLDTDFKTGLSSCQRKVFITSHEAFGYLAHRYGLEQVGISGIEPDTEPTAAVLVDAPARTVSGAPAVFTRPTWPVVPPPALPHVFWLV